MIIKFKSKYNASPRAMRSYEFSKEILETFHFPENEVKRGNVIAIDTEARQIDLITEDYWTVVNYPMGGYREFKTLKDLVEANRFYYHETNNYRYVWFPVEAKIMFIEPGVAETLMGYVKAKGVYIEDDYLSWLVEGEWRCSGWQPDCR